MAYAGSFACQHLEAGKAFNVVNTNAPLDDRVPASYTILATQVPPGMQHEAERRFYVYEKDYKGEVKNIRVLNPSEVARWLDDKAGYVAWKFTDVQTGQPPILH